MNEFGKILIGLGVVLVIAGAVLMLFGKWNLAFGRLPGDIVYRGKNSTVYFPIVTCLVVSVVLTLVMWVVGKIGR